jgi:NADH dehydrogenase
MSEKKPHVVIIGAGFGGIKVARQLAKQDVEVTVIDRHNFHLFQPLLYQISTSILDPDEIAYPIRVFFRKNMNVEFFMAKVQTVDMARKVVVTNHGEVAYDYLVLAAGATTNYFGMKSVEEHAFGMKTLQEAEHIKNHILHMFERANKFQDDEAERRKMLTFVCVGGGPTGIEEAGGISEVVHLVMSQEYHHLDFDEVSVKLIEATDKVMPMLPPNLRDEIIAVLRKKGVEVLLNTQVMGCDDDGLTLKDGTRIPTKTVIWAAGVKAVPFMATLGAEVDRGGRIVVDEHLQVPDHPEVFAIGDCASFMHYGAKRPLPTVAPVAMQAADVCVCNLMKLIHGQDGLEEFHYKDIGTMATIGRCAAVVKMPNGMEFTGFIAWGIWMVVHLWRLAGVHTNMTVILKWLWNLVSGTRLGRIITNISLDEK